MLQFPLNIGVSIFRFFPVVYQANTKYVFAFWIIPLGWLIGYTENVYICRMLREH